MEYRCTHRWQDDTLIRCQIELDPWPAAGRRRNRSSIADLACTIPVAARVIVDIEVLAVARKFEAALLIDPFADLGEDLLQECFVEVRFIL